jgi:hypothetical protein
MGIREVRSPWSSSGGGSGNADHPIGTSPLSAPRRNDGFGHVAGHVGKAASSPVSLAHDLERISAGTGNKVIPPTKP